MIGCGRRKKYRAAAGSLRLMALFTLVVQVPAAAVTSTTGLRIQDLFLTGSDPDLVCLSGVALPAPIPTPGTRVNPACLADIDHPWTTFTLHQWRSSGKSLSSSVIYPTVFQGTFALDVAGVVVGGLDAPPPGVASGARPWAEEFFLELAYGRSLFYSRLDVGLGAKIVQRYVGNDLDRGFATDFGLLYRNYQSKVNIGLAAQNLGGPLWVGSNKQRLPRTYRMGLYRPIFRGIPLMVDYLSVAGRGGAIILGSRAELPRDLNLRLGYMMGGKRIKPADAGSWAVGAGYRINPGLRLDYALLPWGVLGRTHRLTVSFRFGRPVDRTRAMPLPFVIRRTETGLRSRENGTRSMEEVIAVIAGLERRWNDFRPETLTRERRKYHDRLRGIESDLGQVERELRKLETMLVFYQIRIHEELNEKQLDLSERTVLHEIGALPTEEFSKVENRLKKEIEKRKNRIEEIVNLIGRVESVPAVPRADRAGDQISLLRKE